MLQEYKQGKDSSKVRKTRASEVCEAELSPPFFSDPTYVQHWKEYVSRLSAALGYFLIDAKETALCRILPSSSRNTILVSTVYAELSVKWFMSVLHTVFPCIKACSDKKEIPSHLRCLYFHPSLKYIIALFYAFVSKLYHFYFILCFAILFAVVYFFVLPLQDLCLHNATLCSFCI